MKVLNHWSKYAPLQELPFYRTRCKSGDDLTVEEEEDQQGWDRDQKNIHEEQIVGSAELALEIVERELHSHVLVSGQVVEGIGEIVEYGNRLHNNHCANDRLQKRKNDPEKQS